MKNLLLLIIRILAKQKRLFIFTLISLSTSLTLVILTSSYLAYELSCDKYQSNYNRTYRLILSKDNEVGIDDKFYSNLKSDYPAVDKVCRFYRASSMLSADNIITNIDNLVIVDSTVFDIFDYQIISGNKKYLLDGPDKIVLSQSLAKKMFGSQNPIGKPVKINMLVTAYVTGVFADNKHNSHFSADAIVSLYTKNLPWTGGTFFNNERKWEVKSFSYYITVKNNADTSQLSSLLKNAYNPPWEPEASVIALQPLSDIYWNNAIKDYSGHGNMTLMLLLISITIVVVVIAGINYINLSLSNLKAESKIVSILKVNGALQSNMLQYYTLSGFIIFGTAFLVSIALSFMVLPVFNQLIFSNISIEILFQSSYILPFIGIVFLLFFLIGFYPAVLFSGINPISLFQGKVSGKIHLSTISRVLLVFQFVASIVLITSVIMISKQLSFMEHKNPGFNSKSLLSQEIHYSIKDKNKIETYIHELLKNPNVLNLSVSKGIPFNVYMYIGRDVKGKHLSFLNIECDTTYLNLLGIQLLEGRFFLPSDKNCCIITNKLAKDLEFKEPINEKIDGSQIIGVVNDINGESMHNKIKGIVFVPLKEMPSHISIKINPSNIQGTIAYINKQWDRFFPDYVIKYNFYEDIIAMQYEKEQKLAKSICIIAVLAVLLCCLGLLGMVVNVVESRTREIGIRKVNGARISEILSMLNVDIIIWVVAAFLIACPIASYLMYKWLENFAYKTELSWWVFAVAGIIAMAIALITVSWQSYRVAVRNPVEALRYE